MELMFCISIVVMVTQICKCVNIHRNTPKVNSTPLSFVV